VTKKITKKPKTSTKLTYKDKSGKTRPVQIQEKTLDFWERKIKEGNLLKVSAKLGKEEKESREKLALCYRVAHQEGFNEGVDNHFSICLEVEGKGCLLTLPHGILWKTCKPGDFILVDYEGGILRPSEHKPAPKYGPVWLPDISAVKIHGAIH
jgi:hypothetical protein